MLAARYSTYVGSRPRTCPHVLVAPKESAAARPCVSRQVPPASLVLGGHLTVRSKTDRPCISSASRTVPSPPSSITLVSRLFLAISRFVSVRFLTSTDRTLLF